MDRPSESLIPLRQSSAQVLLIGELSAPAMRPVRDWLSNRIHPSRQRIAVDLRSVRRLRDAEACYPDLVLVCQTWPDQFSGVDVHALLTWFPLSRIVCVYDVWCDSDGRSRTEWPLAVRVPASRAAARLEREIDALDANLPPLPLTASRGEIFAAEFSDAPQPVPTSHPTTHVVIDTPDVSLSRLWQTVLGEHGYEVRCACSPPGEDDVLMAPSWPADQRPAEVVLYDTDPESGRQLEAARQIWPQARILGIVGFRRLEEDRRLLASGCMEVIDKVAPLGELLAAVRRLAAISQ